MSCVLVVVMICAIIFVLVGFSFSPKFLLGFGLDLRNGDLSASKEQPQCITLPLGSEVVSYQSHKVHFSTCSDFHVGAGTPGCLRRNFQLSEVLAQTVRNFDYC